MKAKLYLLPNLLADSDHRDFLPNGVEKAVHSLEGLIAESEKEGRKFLRLFLTHEQASRLPLQILSEHTRPDELNDLAAPIVNGETWGLVSDCGLPLLADPGAKLVFLLKTKNVEIKALPGPSSIILALELSGLPSQNFAFHGYLPRERDLLIQKLRSLEKSSYSEDMTHLWIEAPYRSMKMMETALSALRGETYFSIASSLTSEEEMSITLTVSDWKKRALPDIQKKPTVFLLYSPGKGR